MKILRQARKLILDKVGQERLLDLILKTIPHTAAIQRALYPWTTNRGLLLALLAKLRSPTPLGRLVRRVLSAVEKQEVETLAELWGDIPREEWDIVDDAYNTQRISSRNIGPALHSRDLSLNLNGVTYAEAKVLLAQGHRGVIYRNGQAHLVPCAWAPFASKADAEEADYWRHYQRSALQDSIVLLKRPDQGRVNPHNVLS